MGFRWLVRIGFWAVNDLRQRLTPPDRSYACLLHELRELALTEVVALERIAELIVSADRRLRPAVVRRCSSVIVASSLWLVGCARSVVQ
jgi:hypothetical protein